MSWIWLRPRARSGRPLRAEEMCQTRNEARSELAGRAMINLAWQAPLQYAALGALGFAVAIASLVAAPSYSGLFGGALGLLVLAIAAVDARSFIIPDRLTITAFVLGLAAAAGGGYETITENIAAAAARGLILAFAFLVVREIYWRLRHHDGIGLGDIKLAAVAGVWLDWPLVPLAIEIAALAALTGYMARQLILRRPLSRTSKLPFGLFFAPAIWLCWLIGVLIES
jgi:leader peptidase (prepilin peptidase) / N-methyltransferase